MASSTPIGATQATIIQDNEVLAIPQTLLKFETVLVAPVAAYGRTPPDDGTEVMFDINFPEDSDPAEIEAVLDKLQEEASPCFKFVHVHSLNHVLPIIEFKPAQN